MLMKELAAALGISAAMVSKLAKRGMPTDSLERAIRWRRRNLEPGRVKGQRAGTEGGVATVDTTGFNVIRDRVGPGDEPTGGDVEDEMPYPTAQPISFQEVRSRREAAEASLAELKLAEQRGELIRVDAVRHALAKVCAETRDNILQVPDRLSAVLAAETDQARVHGLLTSELHQVLEKLTGSPSSFGRS